MTSKKYAAAQTIGPSNCGTSGFGLLLDINSDRKKTKITLVPSVKVSSSR